jgi:hypothetical protein
MQMEMWVELLVLCELCRGSACYGSYNIGSNTKNSVKPLMRQKKEAITRDIGTIQKTILSI